MTEEKKTKNISPIGLKKRPKYDPIIEDLNQKRDDAASARSQEIHAAEESRIEQSDHGRIRGIAEHGKQINPDRFSYDYLGSFCTHIYVKKNAGGLIAPSAAFVSFTHGPVPQIWATKAIDHLNMKVRESFGIKHPGTLDKRKQGIQALKKDL